MTIEKLKVELKERSYEIEVGIGLLDKVGDKIMELYGEPRPLIIVSNDIVAPLYLARVMVSLSLSGFTEIESYIVPDGEEHKSWDTAADILRFMLQSELERRSVLLALGGGVVGDLAGFVAAVYQRGIDFIQLPTTLLAAVDSSVGGKVAVNHPLGKNMIGAFHQPRAVFADTSTLDTLEDREWHAGMAEVVKYGLLFSAEFFAEIEENADRIRLRDTELIGELILRSCDYKAAVVARDERETGERALLNLGHTLGHALERTAGYGNYRHGEAVAIGMVAACRLAEKEQGFPAEETKRVIELLQKLDLPTEFPASPGAEEILAALAFDKKKVAGLPVFVLPTRIGHAVLQEGLTPERILTAGIFK